MSLYSEKDIEEMGFKELRLAVAEMRAELTKFKKLLEMINEDMESSAIGKTLSVENGKLKTQIKVLAGEISTKVSDEDMESVITQLAGEISTKVSDEDMESAIEQMAGKITSQVIKDIDVSDAIKTELVPSNNGNFDTSAIYKYVEITEDSEGNKQETVKYYYYNDVTEKWEGVTESTLTSFFEQTADGIKLKSIFEQTEDGFKLKGDVKVDGSCILTGSLTFDSSDKPLEVQYSADGVNDWHDTFNPSSDMFMQIKIGAEWSKSMKVVGSDGSGANLPPYIQDTYIDSARIVSPEIYSNEFSVIPLTESFAGFKLYGDFEGERKAFLAIYYDEETAPVVHFATAAGAHARWDFGNTIVSKKITMESGSSLEMTSGSTLNISEGTTVNGLKVTFG